MNENKNNDIKFEDLVDNYTYDDGNGSMQNQVNVQADAPVDNQANVQADAPVDNQANVQTDAPVDNQANVQADAPADNQANVQTDAPTGEQAQGQNPTQQPPVNPYQRPDNPYQNPNPYQGHNPYQNSNPYQNQNPYQRPIWEAPKQKEKPKGTGFNVASLILGILSILCCCVYGFVSIIMGILAIVFYAVSKKKGTSNGMAVAGMICAIFGLLLGILYFIYAVLAFVGVFGAIDAFGSSYLEL